VLVDDLRHAGDVRVVRHAFEQQRGGAVGQRAVDDIAVASDPADVGGAPVHLARAVVEHALMGQRGIHQVAAGGVQHALRLAGGAGGIKDEQRLFGAHLFRRAVAGGTFIRSSYQMSRCWCQAMSPPVRLHTMIFCTLLVSGLVSARSTLALSGYDGRRARLRRR
jgi:hypothetical protein